MAVSVPGARSSGRDSATSRIWTFAGCTLDERSLELTVKGAVVALERKPLEVLLHLLRHAGEVVTKDELAEAVWPGRITTDSNLTKTMAVVRAALAEAGPDAIKTVHGYGYRLVAAVSVQIPAHETLPPRFALEAGDPPPLRPDWILAARLGTGGQGEVWLAHHAQTRAARVFKFAEAGRSLTALKREVTLNRLLRETLSGRDDFLWLTDWNVDEPPFFVESEYVAAGNLAVWAEAQGGLAAVPLERRLELLAQVARAVAAAHAVGVLHKDLKPANVLIAERDGRPRIKLADFGSGVAVDPGAFAVHGITRMGFTQAVPVNGDTSGTPVYLAPEVLAGQPFTVKSDVYALGVMLYQLVVGDVRRALAPGWEKGIADELLREDIAAAAAGDPADRLGDAALLAERLGGLEQRRLARHEARRAAEEATLRERAAAERARAAEQVIQQARSRRRWVLLLVGALAIGATVATALYVETDRALQEARAADALRDAVTIWAIYEREGDKAAARREWQRVAELHGAAVASTADLDWACAQSEQVAAMQARQPRPDVLATLHARFDQAQCQRFRLQNEQAVPNYLAVKQGLEALGVPDLALYIDTTMGLGWATGDPIPYQRELVAYLSRTRGEHDVLTARIRWLLGVELAQAGRIQEAETELQQSLADQKAWQARAGARRGE